MGIWIIRDYERCSGCRLCEIVCSIRNEGKIWPEASRIKIFELVPGISVPHFCSQCQDYPCINACPTNALSVDRETGAVIVDEGKCVLCGLCIKVCPGKVPKILSGKDSVLICDLCGGDPECVKICQKAGYNALRIVERKPGNFYRLYARRPGEITEYLVSKLYGLSSKEVM